MTLLAKFTLIVKLAMLVDLTIVAKLSLLAKLTLLVKLMLRARKWTLLVFELTLLVERLKGRDTDNSNAARFV